MLIFWRLLLGHFIADFTLQTNKVAQWKRVSRWGMVVHVLCHPIMYVIVAWPYLSWTWVHLQGVSLNGWACIVLIALLHWIEDELRVWCIRHGTRDSTAFLLWDQCVHLGVLLALSPSLYGRTGEPWVLAAIGAVLLAHFTSVLIFFVENDRGGSSTVLAKNKYYYMVERLIIASLFLLPMPWCFAALLCLVGLFVRKYRQIEDRTWIHFWIAASAIVIVGVSLRVVLLHSRIAL